MPHSFKLSEAAGKEDRDVLRRAETEFKFIFMSVWPFCVIPLVVHLQLRLSCVVLRRG